MAPKVCFLGAVRRRTMICCRNVKISASIAARDRNRSTTAQTMSLTRSLITEQHRPILGQPQSIGLRQGHPDRVVRRKPHEPAVQKIVVQLLHQLAFRPNAVEHLQQQCAQQLLWRDRGTSFAGVKLPKVTVQLTQNMADKLPDLPQRVVRRPPVPPVRCTKTTRPDP
jgi:hypothetical protein